MRLISVAGPRRPQESVKLLQDQDHLAALIEVDPQHILPPAGKVALHHGGLVRDGSARGHLHSKTMFPRRHLHGMEFMALDTVENDHMFRVCSLQWVRVGQAVIHPDGQMGLREFVLDLDFQHCR